MFSRYQTYYFEKLPISRLLRLDFTHMNFNGLKTGGMSPEEFLALRENIKENGLINPLVVEVDSGNPPRFRIAMGNNRVEAWEQLGHDTIKALVIVKGHGTPFAGLGEYTKVSRGKLELFMSDKHPGDALWRKSSWAKRIVDSIPQERQE